MFEADAIPPKEIFRLPDGDPEEAEHAAETVECSVSSRSVSMVCGFVSRVVRVQSRCSWSVPCILPTIGDPGWIRDEWCRLLSDGAFQLESDELIVSSKSVSTQAWELEAECLVLEVVWLLEEVAHLEMADLNIPRVLAV
eukprot:CAMPEP_0172738008 /NCGR_PEP_ID=MMETSP1074-20121228/119207_1 /TAXON_ID=2916 /ORGANISM="Ceratium fusus, Strain PA161109" /LENGTH=139 /DNA_ID=CAMNT_0013567551 /DNA_START=128 /DNA_END=548 /DNA_ORIENTATION=+